MKSMSSKNPVARAPLRWALGVGVVVWLVASILVARSIDLGSSSTAAIGLLFAPIVGLYYGALASALAGSLRYLWCWWSATPRTTTAAVIGAWVAVIGVSAEAAREIAGARSLRTDLDDISKLGLERAARPELEAFLRQSPYRGNPCALSLVAQNPDASGAILDAIAKMPNPALHRRMPACLGQNRHGLAVMRLVARAPEVMPETLELLAESPDGLVRADVSGNPKVSEATLRSLWEEGKALAAKGDYGIDEGLAINPATPADVLAELATVPNQYARSDVARNPRTPVEALGRLANDPDPGVREWVARNPHTPVEVLGRLANDPDRQVRSGLAMNPQHRTR